MIQQTRHDGLVIHTSDDPAAATRAVVQDEGGRLFLVDTVEETYTDNEGAVYDRADFLAAVVDAFRAGHAKPVQNAEEALGS